MSNIQRPHLTDEQLSDLLDGQLAEDAVVQAHLASCAICAGKLADLRAMRVGLRALHAVGDVPDFRLGADGTPRRSSARRAPRALPPLAARFVSAAMLLCGLTLLLVAFGNSFSRPLLQSDAASTAGQANTTAPTTCAQPQCPSEGRPSPPTSIVARPTPNATPSATPTSANAPDHVTGNSAPTVPLVPIEWGLGVALTLGGGALLARWRPRR